MPSSIVKPIPLILYKMDHRHNDNYGEYESPSKRANPYSDEQKQSRKNHYV